VRRPRLVVRELREPAEYLEASRVAKAAWRFPDLMVPPPPDMITATHAGGMTAGAFEGGRLLAFVHAVSRRNLPEPAIHSHLLAVRPEAQRRGLSVRLKLFQRDWCLERGIRLVTWTYDPFMLRNARLNLVRLGAVVPVFLPNFYGAVGGIYGNLPSDRFEAHWRLESARVTRAARGETEEVPEGDAPLLPLAGAVDGRGQVRLSWRRRTEPTPRAGTSRIASRETDATPSGAAPPDPSARRVLLPFPAGFPGCFRDDPAEGVRVRRRFGRTAAALFAAGYEAVSAVELGDGPAYVLERA